MTNPRFMSHEHVALMNAKLDGALREECAGLAQDEHVHYEITGDPEGIKTWTVTVGPAGMRFALDEPCAHPALLVRASYEEMSALRKGEQVDLDHTMFDADAFQRVSAIVDAGRAVATVEVA